MVYEMIKGPPRVRAGRRVMCMPNSIILSNWQDNKEHGKRVVLLASGDKHIKQYVNGTCIDTVEIKANDWQL